MIELDGRHPADQKAYDTHRTWVLEKDGFKVMRFWNNDVLSNLLEIPLTRCYAAISPTRGEVKAKNPFFLSKNLVY